MLLTPVSLSLSSSLHLSSVLGGNLFPSLFALLSFYLCRLRPLFFPSPKLLRDGGNRDRQTFSARAEEREKEETG